MITVRVEGHDMTDPTGMVMIGDVSSTAATSIVSFMVQYPDRAPKEIEP